MIDHPYLGSGPYCYSSCLLMMLAGEAPEVGVVETLTGSPFGMQWESGVPPFFDPYGWTPEIGVDDAVSALGWTAELTRGGDTGTALGRLASGLADGPVMVGPVEMGHLRHQPGRTGPIGADHYVVVLGMDDEHVLMHDPQGYPYTRLPLDDFTQAWRAETVGYGEPYTMRANFTRVARVDPMEAIRASIPRAIHWLRAEDRGGAPDGLGNGAAATALAAMVESGCADEVHELLVHFAIRVGARRVADAATCLHRVGRTAAASILTEQAKLLGSLQYLIVTGDNHAAAGTLRTLARTYDEMRAALERGSG